LDDLRRNGVRWWSTPRMRRRRHAVLVVRRCFSFDGYRFS